MPYQLHCWPPVTLDVTELLTLLTAIDDELAGADEAGVEEAGADELVATDEVAPPQMLPVTVGRSALPPRLST